MAQSNMNVDFIDDDKLEEHDAEEQKHKNKRAELAHKLAIVLLFDRHADKIKQAKQKAKKDSIKRKGALNGSTE
ncbi:hypothetical protein OGA32_000120 [Salmonella enterica]|nr:hypothetical protein [Salmonella enterica]